MKNAQISFANHHLSGKRGTGAGTEIREILYDEGKIGKKLSRLGPGQPVCPPRSHQYASCLDQIY